MVIVIPLSSNFVQTTLASNYKLDIMPNNELSPDTKLLMDKHVIDGYNTCTVNYSTLSTDLVEYIRTTDTATLSGHWTLSGKNDKTMCLDIRPLTEADRTFSAWWYNTSLHGAETTGKGKTPSSGSPAATAQNAAITYEFYKKKILQKIYDLSTELYRTPHVPSYKGMVVCSNTLDSEEKVKKIYGGIKWQPLHFRFICGAGANQEDNTYIRYGNMSKNGFNGGNSAGAVGGEEYVTLTTENMPNHTHGFRADTESFEMLWEGTVTGKIWVDVETGYFRHHAKSNKYNKAESFSIKSLRTKVSGDLKISTSTLYSGLKETTNKVYSNSNVVSNSRHINMPPFETKYVWIRTDE